MSQPFKHLGISLDVFDPAKPIYSHPDQYRRVSRDPERLKFIRAIDFRKPHDMSIDELLEWAHKEYKELAKVCGATAVVSHEWGLYDLRPSGHLLPPDFVISEQLPQGHVLAAEVSVIDMGHPPSALRRVVGEGIATYRESVRPGKPIQGDVRGDQFCYGVERPHAPGAELQVMYHDIEPRHQNFPLFPVFA